MARTNSKTLDPVASGSPENPLNVERRFGGGSIRLTWEDPSIGPASAEVRLEDITKDGIVVRLGTPITVGQTVHICDDLAERKATVQHCENQANSFLAVLHFIAQERRREDRLATGGTGTLRWSDRGGRHVAGVCVRNATESGVQIEMDERLEPSQMVRLSGETWECQGRVLYCCEEGPKHLAGIQLTRLPYPKSSLDYED